MFTSENSREVEPLLRAVRYEWIAVDEAMHGAFIRFDESRRERLARRREDVAAEIRRLAARRCGCGSIKPEGQSCSCFDNGCQ